MTGHFSTHPIDCGCIDCKAYRQWRGPAVINPPSIIDVGEHKREVWEMRAPREAGSDATPTPRVTRSRSTVVRDRHPFGYKKRRKSKPLTGRIDPADVTVTARRKAKPDPDRYVKDPNSYAFDNRWS